VAGGGRRRPAGAAALRATSSRRWHPHAQRRRPRPRRPPASPRIAAAATPPPGRCTGASPGAAGCLSAPARARQRPGAQHPNRRPCRAVRLPGCRSARGPQPVPSMQQQRRATDPAAPTRLPRRVRSMHVWTEGATVSESAVPITVLRRLSLLALALCAASVPPEAAATFTTRGVKCVPAKEHCSDGSICKPSPAAGWRSCPCPPGNKTPNQPSTNQPQPGRTGTPDGPPGAEGNEIGYRYDTRRPVADSCRTLRYSHTFHSQSFRLQTFQSNSNSFCRRLPRLHPSGNTSHVNTYVQYLSIVK